MAENEPVEELNNYAELYPGRFVKALDKEMNYGKGVSLFTIANVVADKLGHGKNKKRSVIVSFKEISKALVLSKINGEACKSMWGLNVNDWIGKKIALYATDKIAPYPGRKGADAFCIRVYGSPDIAADVTYEFKMPNSPAPFVITLRGPTKKPAAVAQEQPSQDDTQPFDPTAPA